MKIFIRNKRKEFCINETVPLHREKKKKKKERVLLQVQLFQDYPYQIVSTLLQKKPQILLKPSLFYQTKHIDHHYSKELKDQQLFPIATLQTHVLYIQHLML